MSSKTSSQTGGPSHGLPGFFRRHRSMLVTVGIFLGCLVVSFWLLLNATVDRTLLQPFTDGIAITTAWLFMAFGQDVSVWGQTVSVNGHALTIAHGCNGLEALAFFFSAVVAFPTGWRWKWRGLLLVIVGILIINQIRVIALFVVELINPNWLWVSHNYIGQTFVIVMGCGLWLLWAERVFRDKRGGTVRKRGKTAA